jgi:small subunit ribosomal protein S2
MAIKVSLDELVRSGAHFGHQSRRWNPKMKPFLYGIKDGVHVFDLAKTSEKLTEALEFIKKSSKEGKKILILGTKKQAKEKVAKVAEEAGCFYVNERWLGGTFTNFDQIRKSTQKLADMKKKMAEGEYKSFTKKERLLLEREIARLERFFGGIAEITEVPDVLVVIDTKREVGAIKEAQMAGVDTVAIVDSNCDPTIVDYPVPMNDDATKAIAYVLELVKDAVLEGKKGVKKAKKSKAKEEVKQKKK